MKIFNRLKNTPSTTSPQGCVLPEETNRSLSIKILGSGCSNCRALESSVRDTLETMHLDANIEHITDFAQIANYGIMTTPALVINDHIVSCGRVLNQDEVSDFIRKYKAIL